MSLYYIVGDVGTGKTVLATALAVRNDKAIISNYPIEDARYQPLVPSMLMNLSYPATVVLDEAYVYLESRVPGKELPRYLSYVLFQSRKRQLSFILTAQVFGSVDLRFRELSDFIIVADKHPRGFVYDIIKNSPAKGYPRRRVLLPFPYAEKHLFQLYDTMQVIDPSADLKYAAETDKSRLLPEIEDIAKDMLKRARGPITKAAIEDYCLEKGLPRAYRDMIYNRIKRKETAF